MKASTLTLIYSNLTTKIDAQAFIDDVAILQNSVFHVEKESIQQVLLHDISEQSQQIISQVLTLEEVNLLDKSSIENLLEEIKASVQKMPVVTMVVGVSPSGTTIDTVGKWLKVNLGEKVVVHFMQDENLLGGALIVHKGVYKDYSLRKVLLDTLITKREVYLKNI